MRAAAAPAASPSTAIGRRRILRLATIDFWRHVDGCEEQDAASSDLDDRDPDDQSTVTKISSKCPAGMDVLLYRVNDGGHRMPGNFPDTRFPRMVNYMLGPQNHDIDGAEVIWAFFKQFPCAPGAQNCGTD